MRRKAEAYNSGYLLIGLGNPGLNYKETRHNAGFLVVEGLAEKLGIALRKPFCKKYLFGSGKSGGRPVFLLEPLTYMNLSGSILPDFLRRYPVSSENILLICDNTDLPAGEIRLKKGGGTGGHRGIKSVIDRLNTGDFYRLYLGVGRPPAGQSMADYVLETPSPEEKEKLRAGKERAVSAAEAFLQGPPERVMNEYNRRTTAE